MAVRERSGGKVERASVGADLEGLEDFMRRMEKARESEILAVDPAHRSDAINLVHYLALRQGDVRNLQRWLGARGLSSLGRCDASRAGHCRECPRRDRRHRTPLRSRYPELRGGPLCPG